MTTVAGVNLWGTRIGAVSLEDGRDVAAFQYTRAFAASGIQVSPLVMPLQEGPTPSRRWHDQFPRTPRMLADSLPDRYGHALIDAWLARQGRTPESFERRRAALLHGRRGWARSSSRRPRAAADGEHRSRRRRAGGARLRGADPARGAERVVRRRPARAGDSRHPARRHLSRRRTCQGGDRVEPGDERGAIGQVDAGRGFEYWLLKFDGVRGNKDKELDDPQG